MVVPYGRGCQKSPMLGVWKTNFQRSLWSPCPFSFDANVHRVPRRSHFFSQAGWLCHLAVRMQMCGVTVLWCKTGPMIAKLVFLQTGFQRNNTGNPAWMSIWDKPSGHLEKWSHGFQNRNTWFPATVTTFQLQRNGRGAKLTCGNVTFSRCPTRINKSRGCSVQGNKTLFRHFNIDNWCVCVCGCVFCVLIGSGMISVSCIEMGDGMNTWVN